MIYLTTNGSYVRLKYRFFVTALILSRLFSQVVLEGIVKESGSGKPVQYASVAVLDADADTVCTGGITTENGKFHISNVFPGKYPAGIFPERYFHTGLNSFQRPQIAKV